MGAALYSYTDINIIATIFSADSIDYIKSGSLHPCKYAGWAWLSL